MIAPSLNASAHLTSFEPFEPASQTKSKAEARRERRAAKQAAQPGSQPLVPQSRNQELLLDYLRSGKSVFATGGAGTGKTYVPSRFAARAKVERRFDRIIICRPAVSRDKHKLGFRPGNTKMKMAEWMVPIVEALRKEVSAATLDQWESEGKFEIVPFESMRGRTFDDAFIILDEAQNCDFLDLRMFLTRIGMHSQVVITGDTDQIDIHGSALSDVINMVMDSDDPDLADLEFVQFTEDDCVRSPMARGFVRAFKRGDEKKKRDAAARRRLAEGKPAEDGGDVTFLDQQPAFLHRSAAMDAAA